MGLCFKTRKERPIEPKKQPLSELVMIADTALEEITDYLTGLNDEQLELALSGKFEAVYNCIVAFKEHIKE